MKKIVLTGGGTAGHVTPNIALIPALKSHDYDIHYIGSFKGIERSLIADEDLPYYAISTGRFRRYFDVKNFSDPFRVIKGYNDAKKILKNLKPDVVFSKGGFVSVPVIRAAASLKIPCVIHESDMTPGLANKLCFPVATKICCNFNETYSLLPANKAIMTGTPIRPEIFEGDKELARKLCNFNSALPVITVMGGSLGSRAINKYIRASLPTLLKNYQVIHLCGKGGLDNLLLNTTGYKQFEYVKEELKDIMALTDIVVSRAGANAICELLALKKPNILIPLPSSSSRGDQLLNASSFEKQGYSIVINEDYLTTKKLVDSIDELYLNKDKFIANMEASETFNSIDTIIKILQDVQL